MVKIFQEKNTREHVKYASLAVIMFGLISGFFYSAIERAPPNKGNKEIIQPSVQRPKMVFKKREQLKKDHLLIEIPCPSTIKYMDYDPETDSYTVRAEFQVAYGAPETPSPVTEGADKLAKIVTGTIDDILLEDARNVNVFVSGKGGFCYSYLDGPRKGKIRLKEDDGTPIPYSKMFAFYLITRYETSSGAKHMEKRYLIHATFNNETMFSLLNERAVSHGCFRMDMRDMQVLYKMVHIPKGGLTVRVVYKTFSCDNGELISCKDVYGLKAGDPLEEALNELSDKGYASGNIDIKKLEDFINESSGRNVSISAFYSGQNYARDELKRHDGMKGLKEVD